MSLELLKNIEQAEGKAEDVRAAAQREAREIIKGVEEACVADERAAALDHRAQAQQIVENARAEASCRIEAMAGEEATSRAKVTEAARGKLEAAANLIFERVVRDGHR